jgi:AGCS family alanine or glycine:cation symporter
MNTLTDIVGKIDDFVWGPVMLILLVGTGIYLTLRLKFLPQRNLGYALHSVLSKEARSKKGGNGDVSPFSALMTALAATIGTGNIVGVATAMFAGGPGALVWMWVSAFFGLTTKFSECMLAIKYREVNEKGEMSGGPMYTMKNGFKNKKLGNTMGLLFALFTVLASFGIGNMSQANSISTSINSTFGVSLTVVGVVMAVLVLLIVLGGISTISSISSIVVPAMAVFYVICSVIVILGNIANVPHGLYLIFTMAFNPKAVGGGVLGAITVSVMNSVRYGVARGVFSNEAGLGSAAITAAAAKTDDPVRQGYINMTGTFFDTIVVCTLTGVAIAASGVLGTYGSDGAPLQGIQITMAAFSTVLGPLGSVIVSIGIVLFAFSTILGWEYHGEKGWEYLFGTHKFNIIYRIVFSAVVYFGATQSLDLVWSFSDIANALMAIPNLVSMLVLSNVIVKEVNRFQPVIENEKRKAKLFAKTTQTDDENVA